VRGGVARGLCVWMMVGHVSCAQYGPVMMGLVDLAKPNAGPWPT
jgi:hypothetical protein